MLTLTLLLIMSIIIRALLSVLAFFLGENSEKDRDKLRPFECGFDPFKKAHIPFSLRFFLVTVIFLIFDVEIALLLPLGILSKFAENYFISLSGLILSVILILGLIHEWNQGSLTWIK